MDNDLDELLVALEKALVRGEPEEVGLLVRKLVFAAQIAASYLDVWTAGRREKATHLLRQARVALRGTPYEQKAATALGSLPEVAA
ncbi:MAG TPA: hypothetical protein PK082_04240 [Phycisphaerae bacterium]|nr:hypothetical protein [Phycisphaerae bacterium]